MMTHEISQTAVGSPRFTIDCVLASASTKLQADGCVLESSGEGHKLITPEHLRAGDLVKVQLWLEGEEDFVDIRLAVVSRVQPPWVTVGVIRVNPSDRMRMKQFIHTPTGTHVEDAALIDHLLIRA